MPFLVLKKCQTSIKLAKRFANTYLSREREASLSCSIKTSDTNKSMEAQVPYKNKEYQAKYYQANKEKLDEYNKNYTEKVRQKVIEILGLICADCGEKDSIVLQIGHINDDGSQDKKQFKNKRAFYNHILKLENRSEKYKLQCCNCNWRQEYNRRKGL